MGNFRDLEVFHKAHELTMAVYAATRRYPPDELFGLTSQTRRSAASIGSNIAEGSGRDSDSELARFARIALGSAAELEYQLLLARDLGYMQPGEWEILNADVRRVRAMLASLARRLSTATPAPPGQGTRQRRPLSGD